MPQTREQKNVEVVKAFFESIDEDGMDVTFKKHTAPDFIYWVPGLGNVQDRLQEILGPFGDELVGKFEWAVLATTAEGDRVAVEAESHANLKGGKVYNNKYHFLFELRDGKITKCKEYNDTHHARLTIGHILGPYVSD
jgi:ketosteroid isomerase-like protein